MTPAELQQRLAVHGIHSRVKQDEVVVEACRFCGNAKWNLELNVTLAVFHCWACNAGGRLENLLSEWFGEAVQLAPRAEGGGRQQKPARRAASDGGFTSAIPAYESTVGATYLARRGVPKVAAERYGMVVCNEKGHMLYGRLAVPLLDFWSGVPIGFSGRTMTGGSPKYLSTLTTRVVVGYRVRSATMPCVVVEGVFDGVAVHQAGFHTALLLGTSAPQIERFGARLPAGMPLVVMLDGEAAAEAQRLRWTLQPLRNAPVHVVTLPEGIDPGQLHPATITRLVARTISEGMVAHA
jgi:hypothetical protein